MYLALTFLCCAQRKYQRNRLRRVATNNYYSTLPKKSLEIQLKELEIAKSRLTLYAPEDGKIISVLSKQGEMISPNVPVVLLETRRIYYDIYRKRAVKV